jgi:hypothetical protein
MTPLLGIVGALAGGLVYSVTLGNSSGPFSSTSHNGYGLFAAILGTLFMLGLFLHHFQSLASLTSLHQSLCESDHPAGLGGQSSSGNKLEGIVRGLQVKLIRRQISKACIAKRRERPRISLKSDEPDANKGGQESFHWNARPSAT